MEVSTPLLGLKYFAILYSQTHQIFLFPQRCDTLLIKTVMQ